MEVLPTVMFTGNLTSDPELRFTPAGHAVANCSVACNDRVRVDGQWQDGDVTYLNLTVWRKAAENLVESCRKGDTLTGYGRLRATQWEKDGVTHRGFEVVVDEIGPSITWTPARTERSLGEQLAAAAGSTTRQDTWGSTPSSEPPPF